MPYEKDDSTWISVTISRDLDLWSYERDVYTWLDLLSDIGGFNGLVLLVLAFISSVWNYNNSDNFMVSRLFKIRRPEAEIKQHSHYFDKSVYIDNGNFPFVREWLRSLLPEKCHCCK